MFRLRFSLSTLLIATIFAGAVYRVWWRGSDAWTLERTFQTGRLRAAGGSGQFNVAALSSNNRLLAATSSEQKLRLFSVLNGATLWSVDLAGSPPQHRLRFLDEDRVIEIQCPKLNGDSVEETKRYYINSVDATIITDEVRLKGLAKLASAPHNTSPNHSISPPPLKSPDGRRALQCQQQDLCGDYGQGKYLWRLSDAKSDTTVATLPQSLVPWAAQFCPDGKRFAMATFKSVFVCANDDGRLLTTLETGRWNLHLDFSSDGEYLHSDDVSLWQRHWPEAWWGQFCRFEVWLTIVSGGVLLWRAVRAFQRRPCAKFGTGYVKMTVAQSS